MKDLAEWLRATIEAEKALAEAALMAPVNETTDLESTYPNANFRLGIWWAVQDRHEDDGPVRLIKAQIYEDDADPTYTLPAPHIVSGGEWDAPPEAILRHIALHDPRDTIARCEAELSLIDELLEIGDNGSYDEDGLRLLAYGYRHRPGWKADWSPA